ncbi:unnamed protein product [Tilletia laevis]|uniref:Protein SSUH2 n=3 Tax=Tilletia TaxID=13289 RepID=A0A8X7MK26_9BASI|nr:hypothetical protein CF336_g8162 [Tilletia laevis]KAE8238961.1 hypothetical protein A4X06_0g8562 [Tilletia controversa]KAE8244050.1 hypothetical protein A4X03_0g7631 [Tilletia caries]KAE8185329.1 hypothetical protein CF335_g7753 [Tilletia laevis]CAD6886476.1 unnamed protein product [Tilletia caries]
MNNEQQPQGLPPRAVRAQHYRGSSMTMQIPGSPSDPSYLRDQYQHDPTEAYDSPSSFTNSPMSTPQLVYSTNRLDLLSPALHRGDNLSSGGSVSSDGSPKTPRSDASFDQERRFNVGPPSHPSPPITYVPKTFEQQQQYQQHYHPEQQFAQAQHIRQYPEQQQEQKLPHEHQYHQQEEVKHSVPQLHQYHEQHLHQPQQAQLDHISHEETDGYFSSELQDQITELQSAQQMSGSYEAGDRGSSVFEELSSRLQPADVAFTCVDIPVPELSMREIRSDLVKKFPFLVQPPEPVIKARKPGAPPPAMEPKLRSAGPEEQAARERSLILNLEKEDVRSVIKAQIVIESRKGQFRKIGKVQEGESVQPLPVMPSPWLLPIDVSTILAGGKRKNKKTFQLPDYQMNADCLACHGTCKEVCTGCSGIQADSCFWCDGTGKRRGGKTCNECKGKNVYQCNDCNNAGTVACHECEGAGQTQVGYVVEVKLKAVELPPIPVSLLQDERTGEVPETVEAVRECAVDKVCKAAYKLCDDQTTDSVPVVPVMARCFWERSVIRTVSVVRPLNVKWKKGKMTGEDSIDEYTRRAYSNQSIPTEMEDPSLAETRYFVVPSDPTATPYEMVSRSRANSRAGTPSQSRRMTPAHTPGHLSPRQSSNNLAGSFRGASSAMNSALSSPGYLNNPDLSTQSGLQPAFSYEQSNGSVKSLSKLRSSSMSKLFSRRKSSSGTTSPAVGTLSPVAPPLPRNASAQYLPGVAA